MLLVGLAANCDHVCCHNPRTTHIKLFADCSLRSAAVSNGDSRARVRLGLASGPLPGQPSSGGRLLISEREASARPGDGIQPAAAGRCTLTRTGSAHRVARSGPPVGSGREDEPVAGDVA